MKKVDSMVSMLHKYRQGSLRLPRLYFFILLSVAFIGCVGKGELATVQHSGTTYYVSATGSDGNAGTSPSEAWKTISKVNETVFKPGDRILLEGGQIFTGNLYLNATNCPNSPENPIKIGSYGEKRATIEGKTGTAIYVHNCGGVEISDLNIFGPGTHTELGDGIAFYTDIPGNAKLEHVYIDSVVVRGFGDIGISIGEYSGGNGFRDVRITNSKVHNNGRDGISIYGFFSTTRSGYCNEKIHIASNEVYDNPGKPGDINRHTGNGILVSNTDGAIIENNVVYNNGAENIYSGGGPVGIWAWDSNDVTIQFNESHHNKTGSIDGGGFDLDGGVTNSVMQYNYSHDNYGAGYLVATFWDARPTKNIVIRYNISENDGRNGGYAGIFLLRDKWIEGVIFEDLEIYNNTIYISPAPGGPTGDPAAFKSVGSKINNVKVFNNLFVTTGGVNLILKTDRGADISFYGNNYFSSNDAFSIFDSGIIYDNLAAWRSRANQELLEDAPVGMNVNPLLIIPHNGDNIQNHNDTTLPGRFHLARTSPMIDAGLDLTKLFGIDPGIRDYYSNRIPYGKSFDIGAHEWSGTHVQN